MASDPLFIAIIVMLGVVLGILALGIGGFGKGGEFNRKHGNRLMRYRIAAQFVAVLMILLLVWLRGRGS
jgi:hypothetical protein